MSRALVSYCPLNFSIYYLSLPEMFGQPDNFSFSNEEVTLNLHSKAYFLKATLVFLSANLENYCNKILVVNISDGFSYWQKSIYLVPCAKFCFGTIYILRKGVLGLFKTLHKAFFLHKVRENCHFLNPPTPMSLRNI